MGWMKMSMESPDGKESVLIEGRRRQWVQGCRREAGCVADGGNIDGGLALRPSERRVSATRRYRYTATEKQESVRRSESERERRGKGTGKRGRGANMTAGGGGAAHSSVRPPGDGDIDNWRCFL